MIPAESKQNSLGGAFDLLMNKIKKNIDNSLPCQVVSVNETRTIVTVKPLIKVIANNGEAVSRGDIKGITVQTFGAGGFFISPPINEGDLGWLQASDRDISVFLQSYEDSEPPTGRKHSFSDARFIPDIMRNFTISSEDETALVISSADGSTRIAIDDGEIRVTAPSGATVNGAQITDSGDVVTASGVSLDDFKAEYDAHMHTYTWTGSAGSGNTGTPS
jgi:hypothetical protein